MEQPEWSLKTINQHPFPQHQQRSMWSTPTPLQFLPSLFCYHLLNPATFASFLSFVNPIMSHLWAFPLAVHLLFPLPGLLSLQLQLWLSLLHPSSHRQSTPRWPSLLTWANLTLLHYFISLTTRPNVLGQGRDSAYLIWHSFSGAKNRAWHRVNAPEVFVEWMSEWMKECLGGTSRVQE